MDDLEATRLRVLDIAVRKTDEMILASLVGPIPTTLTAGDTLTAERIRDAARQIENKLLIGDVDAFLQLGAERYQTYSMLRDGGGLFVRDPELAQRLLAIDPDLRVMVKPWLPAPMYAVSQSLWEAAVAGERVISERGRSDE